MRYMIRAEFEDSTYKDFHVGGDDQAEARERAQDKLRLARGVTRFDWRGMVCFAFAR